MTLPNSVTVLLLVIMVTRCFLMTDSAEEKLSAVDKDRQSRQMLVIPESYNFPSGSPLPYYNPYGQAIAVSAGHLMPVHDVPYVYSPWSSAKSGNERAFQTTSENINIAPSSTGCLIANIDIDGAAGCVKSTQAQRGTISVTFPVVDQIANIVISAPRNYKVILSCTTVTNVIAFTDNNQITATGMWTETRYSDILLGSVADQGAFTCSWETAPL